MAAIRLEGVRKTFGRSVAVEQVDLDIADGEFLVLLGPSGCGKTTTLNCIAGLEQPSAGRILFDGVDVTRWPPHARNVAMVFQSALLYPHMTGRRNIETSLRSLSLETGERQKRLEEAVRMLEIEDLLDKLPSQMSGGQRQRVATAKAIVREPTAFLLDEPLSALDAALRSSLRSEIVNLQKRLGTTTVFVTHDQVEAMTMGDRIAVMNQGRVEQMGTPTGIYSRPETLFVAGFIGSPPMNLVAGEVVRADHGTVFVARELRVPVEARPGPAVLGVRPQHLRVQPEETAGALPVTVFALEHLGRESVMIMEDAERRRIQALVEPEFETRTGERLLVAPDPARCLIYDPERGLLG